jgi:hypothetical protein
MKTQLTIRRTILAMALAAFGASGMAIAAPEQEPNNSLGSPQTLEIGEGGVATITGSIAGPSDVDFYSFEAKARDANGKQNKISIDIDGTTFPQNLVVYVFGPDGQQYQIGTDADYDPINDPGSVRIDPKFPRNITLDPRLDVLIDKDGVWTVAVVEAGVTLNMTGGASGQGLPVPTYTLIVAGLTAPMVEMSMDIKPGNELSVLNPKSMGAIPVALLSNADFDPFEVDVASLRFGHTGNEPSFLRCAKDGRDLNADGKPDRLCHFDNGKAGFLQTDTTANIKGMARGKPFQGKGNLKVVPQKFDE